MNKITYSLFSLEQIFLKFALIIFLFCFLFFGGSYLFDIKTLFYTEFLILLCFLLTKFFKKDLKKIGSIIVLNLIFFVLLRIFCYLITPKLVVFPYNLSLNYTEVNRALEYLICSISLFSAGIIFYDRFKHILKIKKFNLFKKMTAYYDSIFLIFIINVFFAVVSFFYFEYSFYNWKSSQPITLKVANVFFDINVAYIFSLVLCLKYKKYIPLVIFTFILLTLATFTGKRVIPLFLFFTFVSIFYFIKIRFKFSFKLAIISLMIFSILVASSLMASKMRSYYAIKFSKYSDLTLVNEKLINTHLNEAPESHWFKLFNRLGQFDYDVIGHSDHINSVITKNYFNFIYLWKVLANAFWIGDPYSEATLNTSRLLPLLLDVHSYNYIKNFGYNSDIYGISVMPFLYFDLFYGGFFIFLLGIFFGFIYSLKHFFPSLLSSTYQIFTLTIILPMFLFNSGLDWLSFNIFVFGCRFLFALFLLSFFQSFIKRIRI